MKAVILAAAPSERLLPFTETRAKSMLHVAGRTILEYMAQALREAGIVELLVVLNHKREGIQNFFEHGHRFGLDIEYVVQDPLDGIGAAVRRCEDKLQGEPFLLVYGDVLTTGKPFASVLQRHAETGKAVAALSLPPSSTEFGNVYVDDTLRITRVVEKPSDGHHSNYVFAGIYLLAPSVFGVLDRCDDDVERTFQALIEQGHLYGTLWDGGWIDVGRPWQILAANHMIMERWHEARIDASARLEGNVRIEGAVRIEADVVVSSGSVLKGPCFIGRGTYIGNRVLVREYSSLGPDSVVGYSTELKNCILFGRSELGRLSFIGDSVIGEGVHLASGVTTVNLLPDGRPVTVQTADGPISTGMTKLGAFVGDNVHIGAQHVLAPGACIRAGSFAGDLTVQRSIL